MTMTYKHWVGYKEWLDGVEIPPIDNLGDVAKKLLILYNKKYNPDQASKIMKRLYSLFHENAANRWRRWDYVKPEDDQWFVIKNKVRRTPIVLNNNTLNNKMTLQEYWLCHVWYPIPKID